MEEIHNNQMSEVLPYQYKPVPMENTSTDDEKSDSESESSSDEEVDEACELENAWCLQSLSWCKCGHCGLTPKAVESFCQLP